MRRPWSVNEKIATAILIWILAFYAWQCGKHRRLLTLDEAGAAYYSFMNFDPEGGQR